MYRGQGKHFSEAKIEKIKLLLATTDMTMLEIAGRMGCTGSAIVAVNRKFSIRLYKNRRCQWLVNDRWLEDRVDAG